MPKGPRIVDGNWAPKPSGFAARRRRDELDQRTFDDDVPVYRVGEDDHVPQGGFAIGAAVSHQTLGTGRVVDVSGSGRDQKVIVDFGGAGRKTVYARFLHGADDGLN
jgi:hypothetical protein